MLLALISVRLDQHHQYARQPCPEQVRQKFLRNPSHPCRFWSIKEKVEECHDAARSYGIIVYSPEVCVPADVRLPLGQSEIEGRRWERGRWVAQIVDGFV